MILSILIATLESRRTQFEQLYAQLRYQIRAHGLHGRVEILSCRDNGKRTIGSKRNQLLAEAGGDYVCFVDDDDTVSAEYVGRLAAECVKGCDCVGIVGQIMWHGGWTPFVHSLQYRGYGRLSDGTFTRPPNHINPIKRSIATKYPFPLLNHGEDTAYAMAMQNADALKTEAMLGPPAVYFYTPARGPKS